MPLRSRSTAMMYVAGVFSQFEMLPCTYHICGVAEYPCHSRIGLHPVGIVEYEALDSLHLLSACHTVIHVFLIFFL